MIAGILTEGLPEGWMISMESKFDGRGVEFIYKAKRFGTRTTKRFLRKPVTVTGWLQAGFESRYEDATRAWIISTDAALESKMGA